MVWAECLFADPVADIAVLGVPDEQYLSSEAAAFEALVGVLSGERHKGLLRRQYR